MHASYLKATFKYTLSSFVIIANEPGELKCEPGGAAAS